MRLTIESMAYGADAVSHDEGGKAVFVAGGVPGDVVEASVTSEGRSFSRATVTEVLQPSEARVASRCPYAGVCGGCPWSVMTYEAQLAAKRKNVRDALMRIGRFSEDEVDGLLQDIVPSDEQWGYRNKVELAVIPAAGGRGIVLGMHERDGKGVVPIDRCLLLGASAQRVPKAVSGALRFMGSSRELGMERVGIRSSERTGSLEVALWTDPEAFPRNEVAKVITDAAHPTSIARVLVKEGGAARKVSRVERLAGRGVWTERIAGGRMTLSAPSFFQVNTAGAERLVSLVMDALQPGEDDVVCDLYCGAGTFTLPLAKACPAVIAVESYGPAVRDLKANVERRGLQDSVECIGDDAARVLDLLEDATKVVVDPPRAGLDPSVVHALGESDVEQVAYVSCDPATLARDLALFVADGRLAPVSATPVDLFPQTFHVETVVHLARRR